MTYLVFIEWIRYKVLDMSCNNDCFPLELLPKIQAHPENFQVLERIPYTLYGTDSSLPIQLAQQVGDERTMILLDTETTGLDNNIDKVIELGMVKVKYSPSMGIVTSIISIYDELEDPKMKIPADVVRITGITDEDVKDKLFTEQLVYDLVSDNPLIVAHNACFDRPFFEKRFPQLSNLPWACSIKEIPWAALGYSSSKLEYISYCSGYFYSAHRAIVDCLALLWLLNTIPSSLSSLLTSADNSSYKIFASGAPFDVKDVLKSRRYRWDANNKVWYKDVQNLIEFETERKFLIELYDSTGMRHRFLEFNASTRYK